MWFLGFMADNNIDMRRVGVALVEFDPEGKITPIALSADVDLIRRAAQVMADFYADVADRPPTTARGAMAAARLDVLRRIAGWREPSKPIPVPAWWPVIESADKEDVQSEQ